MITTSSKQRKALEMLEAPTFDHVNNIPTWTVADELAHMAEWKEPDGPWQTQLDGLVFDQQQICDAQLSAAKFNWKDEEGSDFYPSLTAHIRFTKEEKRKQQANAAVVVNFIAKNEKDEKALRAGWLGFANRYSKEHYKWISPRDYALLNCTFRRCITELKAKPVEQTKQLSLF